MAEINISIDSEKKTLKVMIDGKTIPDVESAFCERYVNSDGDVTIFESRISTYKDMGNNVRRRITYYTNSGEHGKSLSDGGKGIYDENLPGFVGEESDCQVKNDIAKYFGIVNN